MPLIVFAGVLVYQHHVEKLQEASARVLETTRSIRRVLDTETRALTAALEVLALSQGLQNDDFDRFRRNADAFLRNYPEKSSISIADRDGNQLFNSRLPAGQTPPPIRNRALFEKAIDTGAPVYSSVFTGSVLKEPIIAITVPVFRDDKAVYALSLNPPLTGFQAIIDQARLSRDWTVSIFDQTGTNFARVPNTDRTVGQRAAPSLYDEMFKRDEAVIPTVSLEGVPLLAGFSRSPVSGWIVAAGIATPTLTAPLWTTLAITAAIGIALLMVGLAFAVQMATTIARAEAMHSLLINELNHRVKNTLATVQSIANRTFRGAENPDEARLKFGARLSALGRAHDVLSDRKWESAEIREVVERVLLPFVSRETTRFHVEGPALRLSPQSSLGLSMVLHELATNAVKYGALSSNDGSVDIRWSSQQRNGRYYAELAWAEHGGPTVTPPTRQGFGTVLIEQLTSQIGGEAAVDYRADGVCCTLVIPAE